MRPLARFAAARGFMARRPYVTWKLGRLIESRSPDSSGREACRSQCRIIQRGIRHWCECGVMV